MREIIVVAHNIRSVHNIGSIFRTAEGFGVKKIIISGYSPYPTTNDDKRLPHIRKKMTDQIHKTALGAEAMVPFEYVEQPDFDIYKNLGYKVVGLEQDITSILLKDYKAPDKILLILGEEVNGITKDILEICDDLIEIPMIGKKESFNVSVAAGIALYGLTI